MNMVSGPSVVILIRTKKRDANRPCKKREKKAEREIEIECKGRERE